jgi:hypothetical protein
VVAANPGYFRVNTPIQLDNLAQFLAPHPNQALVQSWLRGLTNGVWPFAGNFPLPPPPVPDNHKSARDNPQFLRDTRDAEIAAKRWSSGFTKLLPGMRVSPLGIVPKPHSAKLRLVTDFSAPHPPHPRGAAVNDAFAKEDRKVLYDNCRHLGAWLRQLYKERPECFRDPDFVLCSGKVFIPYGVCHHKHGLEPLDGERSIS